MMTDGGPRKLLLTAHVVSSVGWLGAVIAFLALAVSALVGGGLNVTGAVYVAMDVTGWFVLVPMSVASLVTGVAASLLTKWGLWRHYWVVFKLGMNVIGSAGLVLHMAPIDSMARLARDTIPPPLALRDMNIQLVVTAGAALLMLLVATVLSVYKPRGVTRYGNRTMAHEHGQKQDD